MQDLLWPMCILLYISDLILVVIDMFQPLHPLAFFLCLL